uniref:Uncharacterized protein n=1 Tax=Timema genevievae TaxID=629358 RepID=A0A7R9JWJ8_TIMGE|nr:unnamed protein product [Timema genevievae]
MAQERRVKRGMTCLRPDMRQPQRSYQIAQPPSTRYSSPMTSLVLTDSSQLISDSQHLGYGHACDLVVYYIDAYEGGHALRPATDFKTLSSQRQIRSPLFLMEVATLAFGSQPVARTLDTCVVASALAQAGRPLRASSTDYKAMKLINKPISGHGEGRAE